MTVYTFGGLFKTLRIENRSTLRKFCLDYGYDAGNISRLERGLQPPPRCEKVLIGYARALKIQKGSRRWMEFCDLAFISSGRFPPWVMEDEELVRKLPLLLGALKGFSAAKMNRIIEMVRKA